MLFRSGSTALFTVFTNDVGAQDHGGQIIIGGRTGNGVDQYGFAGIKAAKQTAAADGSYAGYLAFYTMAAGGSLAEAMRLDGAQVATFAQKIAVTGCAAASTLTGNTLAQVITWLQTHAA